MVKVLHLEASTAWGGQEIRILQEAQTLRAKGYEIYFATQKKAILAEAAKEKKFCVFEMHFQKWAWMYSIFKLSRFIIKNKITLINTHSSLDSWLGGIVGKILRIKVLRTRHLSTPMKSSFHSYILYNILSDFVITTCQKTAFDIAEKAKLTFDRCISIPTGVQIEALEEGKKGALSFRQKFNLKTEDTLVGFVGFMRSWKGIKDFLQAAKLLEHEKDIHWIIIGGGHEKEYIKYAESLKLNNVIFTHYLQNPYSGIAALDIFVLLSVEHEGVSQAALQAAYLEKPLITTSTGGLREICLHNITGIRVNKYSSQEVANAVMRLKQNQVLSRQMGLSGKNLVLQQFTHDKMCSDIEKCYRRILT